MSFPSVDLMSCQHACEMDGIWEKEGDRWIKSPCNVPIYNSFPILLMVVTSPFSPSDVEYLVNADGMLAQNNPLSVAPHKPPFPSETMRLMLLLHKPLASDIEYMPVPWCSSTKSPFPDVA